MELYQKKSIKMLQDKWYDKAGRRIVTPFVALIDSGVYIAFARLDTDAERNRYYIEVVRVTAITRMRKPDDVYVGTVYTAEPERRFETLVKILDNPLAPDWDKLRAKQKKQDKSKKK